MSKGGAGSDFPLNPGRLDSFSFSLTKDPGERERERERIGGRRDTVCMGNELHSRPGSNTLVG